MRERREIRKIEKNELFEVLNKIKSDPESIKHIAFNYNGILIYVKNRIPATVNERYKKLYLARRNSGLCIKCSKPAQINPKTNKPYRFCEEHRIEELTKKKEERIFIKQLIEREKERLKKEQESKQK
ncbi:MAG TPA: hypothetical protein PLE45_08845 [Spirochaetota bacterium]|nr:hypothetical protein [Spirochaetota bacterium]HOL57705.1 hypothetical protein [Spirochaetota bacterium]HPP04093.1 hypothetical protein [Spirochaetota bacterium]